MRRLATVVAGAFIAGCGSTTDITIDVTDEDNDCAAVFAGVNAISIELIATNGRCRIAHECASTSIRATSLADVEQALRDTADVLLEVDAGEAQTLVINGRPQKSCFPSMVEPNEPLLCGYAPLKASRDGRLVVELTADGTTGVCPESIEICP